VIWIDFRFGFADLVVVNGDAVGLVILMVGWI
jgi:hypothetical protein